MQLVCASGMYFETAAGGGSAPSCDAGLTKQIEPLLAQSKVVEYGRIWALSISVQRCMYSFMVMTSLTT